MTQYLYSALCVFEIHNSINEGGVTLFINIPSNEASELKRGVLEDFNCIIQALSDIQAEKASASSDYDKKLIFK